MEYNSLRKIKYYSDCEPLVSGLGYLLVDLKVAPLKGSVHITCVIAPKDSTKSIGVDDCSKVHHALLPRLEALLGTDNTYMEVTSPGMERNIKNAAEFELFVGREVRVWDKTKNDWVGGIVSSATDKSVTLGDVIVNYDDIAKAKFIHN